MGVVNITPDSFYDGGRHADTSSAVAHAERLIGEGADLLDLGAESTRPGASPVPWREEAARLLPVLRALRESGVPLSVDTLKPAVMRAALDEGASMINDVGALMAEGAMQAVAGDDCAVCLMHMRGEPRTMQESPRYGDVVAEVRDFLTGRARAARDAGIEADRIVIDPGFGFGKTVAHNMRLLNGLRSVCDLDYPVLVGLSRKSSLGSVTGRGPDERLAASVAAMLLAVERGAAIVRVHDVAETRDALAVRAAMLQADSIE